MHSRSRPFQAAGRRLALAIAACTLALGALPEAERHPLQGHPDDAAAGGADEQLPEARLTGARGGADQAERLVAHLEAIGGPIVAWAPKVSPSGHSRGPLGLRRDPLP